MPHVFNKVEKHTNMKKRETEVIKKSNCCVQKWKISSVQSLSWVWLFFPVHHQLLELAQVHVHWVGAVIQSSHPLSSPSPPAFSIRVFSNQSVLHIRWPKYWSFSFNISPSNEHPGLISFRMDWLDLLAVQGTQESSPTPQFKIINYLALSFLYSPSLTSIHDYWKNHSLN